MTRLRLATTWLDGCSGCHMSFLDLDERLIELAEYVDLVYSPLVDVKEYPAHVDICLVEGAVSNEDDLRKVRLIRDRTATLVSFGDCAVTTNVPGMRNAIGPEPLLRRAYLDVPSAVAPNGVPSGAAANGVSSGAPPNAVSVNTTLNQQLPGSGVPGLLPTVLPVHHVVDVDVFLPGCPPSADLIWQVIRELITGVVPNPAIVARFGR